MTIHFVDDTATGANDGTSKTDAWTSYQSSTGVAAGDTIRVASTHDEIVSGAFNPDWLNGTNAAPIKIISVDFSDDSYASRGARIGADGANFVIAGVVQFYGMKLDATTGDFFFLDDGVEIQVFDDCAINVGDGNGDFFSPAAPSIAIFRNCTITLNDTFFFAATVGCHLHFINCDLVKAGAETSLILGMDHNAHYIFEGCDLTDWTTIVQAADSGAKVHIKQCQMKSGFALFSGTIAGGQEFLFVRSHSDTNITVPKLGLQELQLFTGAITADLTSFRTGGADDGEQANAHSWKMVSNANTLEFFDPLCTPWGVRWVDGGAEITLTFNVASGGTLNDDDFWIEMLTPDETATATTLADFRTSRMADPQATPAALTTDGDSTWNGSGVGTKQKVSFTFTPDIAGPVKFRACLAKPSTTVYFDPKVGVA